MDVYNNEEGQRLDEYQDKADKYIQLFLFSQKKSNRPTNSGKVTRNLNHFLCIAKLLYQIISNFVLEIRGGKNLKAKKKISTKCPQKRIESYLAFKASTTSTASTALTASIASIASTGLIASIASTASIGSGTTKFYCFIREHLESYLSFIYR